MGARRRLVQGLRLIQDLRFRRVSENSIGTGQEPHSGFEGSAQGGLGAGTAALAWADPTRGTYRALKARIANLALKNRLVRAAAAEGAFPNGEMVDGGIELYRGLAPGGAGLIIKNMKIATSGRSEGTQTCIYEDRFTPALRKIAEVAHANGNGCKIVAQLNHAGMQSGRLSSVGPSSTVWPNRQNKPRPLTTREVEEIVTHDAEAARRAEGCWFSTASNSTRRMATSSTPCSPPLPTTGPTSTGASIEKRVADHSRNGRAGASPRRVGLSDYRQDQRRRRARLAAQISTASLPGPVGSRRRGYKLWRSAPSIRREAPMGPTGRVNFLKYTQKLDLHIPANSSLVGTVLFERLDGILKSEKSLGSRGRCSFANPDSPNPLARKVGEGRGARALSTIVA